MEDFQFNKNMIKAIVGEFLVTFLFIFTICMNGLANPGNVVASGVSTGFAAVALIFAFGGISGAHFNPAVTVGAMIGMKINPIKGAIYIVAQVAAAIAAVGVVMGFVPKAAEKLVLKPAAHVGPAIGMEILLTFILVFVIYATALGVSTDQSKDIEGGEAAKAEAKLNFAPIAIGLCLGFLCFLGGSVSGGCFNPARALAPAILANNYNQVWVYLVGDFIGAAAAAVLHTYLFCM